MPKKTTRKELILQHGFTFGVDNIIPDVPTNVGVSHEKILQIDPEPMFMTLPWAVNGAIAEDGFTYTKEFNDAVRQQMQQEIITADWGHHVFDSVMPVVHWVGAAEDGAGKQWVKGFVSDPAYKRQVQVMQATGAKVGTSIVASFDPSTVVFDAQGNWSVDPSSVIIHKIDFVPPKMAALEMDRPMKVTQHSKGDVMTRDEIIAQLTVEDLPVQLRDAVLAQAKPNADVVVLQQQNASLVTENKQLKLDLFDAKLAKIINSKLTIANDGLFDYVQLKVRNTLEHDASLDLEKVIDDVLVSNEYNMLAKAAVTEEAGPAAIVGEVVEQTNDKFAPYIEQADALAQRYGISINKKG